MDHLFGYTGRPLDEATGLQNNLNRWYDAGVGRWLSEDPIGFEDSFNLYAYARSNPLSFTDSNGLAANWHHFLPQAFEARFAKAGIEDIHDAALGLILEAEDHTGTTGLHRRGWNNEWAAYFRAHDAAGTTPTKRGIMQKLEKLKSAPAYSSIIATGVKPKVGYKAWKKLTAEVREKVIREAEEKLLAKGSKKVIKKVGGNTTALT